MRWIILFLLLISHADAHLAGGEDTEKNGMWLDFGYAPRVPTVGNLTQIGMVSYNLTDGVTAKTTHVEVAIEKEGITKLNETIEVALAQFDTFVMFDDDGLYTAHITFFDEEKVVVNVSFELPVSKAKKSPFIYVGGILLGLFGLVLLAPLTKKKG